MTEVILITGSILAIIGIGVSMWSIINTRKRYHEEYMRRKRHAETSEKGIMGSKRRENPGQTIKSFIYLDEYKMYSISSQIFEGITDYLIEYQGRITEEQKTQKGEIASGRIMADILKSESDTQEKRYLHDYSYTLFEDYLKKSEKILSLSAENIDENIKCIDNAGFVEVRAKAVFNDISALKSTIEQFNKLGEGLAYITNFEKIEEVRRQLETAAESIKDRNQKSRLRQQLKELENIERLAKDQGLHQDPVLLEQLAFVLDYGFQDQFEVRMPIEPYVFSSSFNREYLRENENLLVSKYSRLAEKEFVLVGTIAQSSSKATDHEEGDKDNAEFEHLKERIMYLVEMLGLVESTFSGKLANEIVIDPIALYREI